MKKLIFACLFLSQITYAQNFCPSSEQKGYHPIPEAEFSMAKALKHTLYLQKYFEGKELIEHELVLSAQLIIEGAYLRNEVVLAKDDSKYLQVATKQFCNFIANKAYYMH